MRWTDILLLSLQNLKRRRLRTLLTMLGVVIGTAAIVVTLSLGAGAEEAQMKALEKSSNLRLIEVYPYYGAGSGGRRVTRITDATVRDVRRMSGVKAVTPLVSLYFGGEFIVKTGKYENSTVLMGVYPEDFAQIQGLKSGHYFSGSTSRMEFIMSEIALLDFQDPKKEREWVDYYSILYDGGELPLPNINWYSSKYEVTLRYEDYSNYEANNYEPEVFEKTYPAKLTGIIQANLNDYQFTSCAVVNLNWLKKMYKENKGLFKELGVESLDNYDTVQVLAATVGDVEEVCKQLNEYGLQYQSPMETVNTLRQQIGTMQAFLGFIGAISMLVAALSIANTMMMSIYERTREIGVMKVLGCSLRNIRMLFLSEAAYIGVFGGGAGLLASLLLSYALNHVQWMRALVASIMSSSAMFSVEGAATSVISPALGWGAWAFVIGVSVFSGLYPAYRAMRLSSLAAIRNGE